MPVLKKQIMLSRVMLLLAVTAWSGCNFFKTSSEEKSPEEKLLEEVKKAEATLYGEDNNFKFDEKLAFDVIKSYEEFVQKYPKSKASPEMLLKSADLHRAMKSYTTALETYKRIETDYPDFEKIPQVIFLEGFVYENELYKLEKAKERYEFFLSKYPSHELADDVKFSLQNLGKSPEEIIKEFEQKQPAKADTAAS